MSVLSELYDGLKNAGQALIDAQRNVEDHLFGLSPEERVSAEAAALAQQHAAEADAAKALADAKAAQAQADAAAANQGAAEESEASAEILNQQEAEKH